MAVDKNLIDVLRQIGPGASAKAAGEGVEEGFASGVASKQAAFKQRLEEAGILRGKDVQALIPTLTNVPQDREFKDDVLGPLATMAKASNQPEPGLSPYQQEQLRRADERAAEQKRQFEVIQGAREKEEQRRTTALNAQISNDLTFLRKMGSNAKKVVESYSPTRTGLVDSALQRAGQALDVNPKGIATFRSAVAGIRNADIKTLSGTAVSAQEFQRVRDELPGTDDGDTAFVEKWNKAASVFNELMDEKERDLGRDLRVERWPMIEAKAQAPKTAVPTYDDPAKEARYQAWKKANGK